MTEVRASGRRPKDAAFAAGRPERDGPRESDQPRGAFAAGHDVNDDSYEAAMKAADALFAGQRSDDSPRANAAERMPAVAPDHAPSTRNGALARSTAHADAVFAPPVEPAATTQRGRDLPEGGGRILQAIEHHVESPLAALEAERAPKRRGRKPGSKNRPKVPVGASAAATQVATTTPYVAQRVPTAQRPDAGARTAALVALLPEPLAPIAAAVRRAPALVPPLGKERDRFAWVRTKLRPGEKWKRRLPKVAW